MSRALDVLAGALLGAALCTRFDGAHVVTLGCLTIATAIAIAPRLLVSPPADPRGVSGRGSRLLGTPER